MNDYVIFGGAICEVISFIWIYYLWTVKKHVPIWERCVLTAVLLVPVAGWLFYGFIMNSSDPHSDILTEYDDGRGGSPPSPMP